MLKCFLLHDFMVFNPIDIIHLFLCEKIARFGSEVMTSIWRLSVTNIQQESQRITEKCRFGDRFDFFQLGDNCIQNIHFGRYIVEYTVRNLVLCDFQT